MGRPQSAVHEGVEQYKRAALGLTLSAEREEGTRRGLHPQHTASNASSTLDFWPRFSQPGVIKRFEAGRGSETTNRFFARMLQGTCVGGRASARQGGAVEGGAANYNERIYIERTRA